MPASEISLFMQAISAQESGGDPTARNPTSGAYGEFQIMGDNWGPWSREVFGRVVPQTAENQRKVARFKFLQYYEMFGSWEAVAVAWFAGPGRARRYVQGDTSVLRLSDGNMTVGQYIAKMRKGMDELRGRHGWEATSVADTGYLPSQEQGQTVHEDAGAKFDAQTMLAGMFSAISERISTQPGDDSEDDNAAGYDFRALFGAMPIPEVQPAANSADSPSPSAVSAPSGGDLFTPQGNWTAEQVAKWAEQVAERFGLRISSHVRDPEHNAAVGGAPNSDHLWGGGIDFAGSREAMEEFAAWAQQHVGEDGPFRIVLWDVPDHHDHVHVSFHRDSSTPAPLRMAVA